MLIDQKAHAGMPLLLEGTSRRFPAKGDNVIRLDDGEKGLSDRTLARRLATLSGLYGYLSACNLIGANPVPTGLKHPRAHQPPQSQNRPTDPQAAYPASPSLTNDCHSPDDADRTNAARHKPGPAFTTSRCPQECCRTADPRRPIIRTRERPSGGCPAPWLAPVPFGFGFLAGGLPLSGGLDGVDGTAVGRIRYSSSPASLRQNTRAHCDQRPLRSALRSGTARVECCPARHATAPSRGHLWDSRWRADHLTWRTGLRSAVPDAATPGSSAFGGCSLITRLGSAMCRPVTQCTYPIMARNSARFE